MARTDMPPGFEAAFLEAAERLDSQATLDTVLALTPWLHHLPPCQLGKPCQCGLMEVLEALRNGK